MQRILQTILGSAILSLGFLIPMVRAAHLDRVPQEMRACMEAAMGSSRYHEMTHTRAAAPTPEERPRLVACGRAMGERMRRESRAETAKVEKAEQPLVKLPPLLGQCLHEKLGKAAFLAIKTGVRAPEVGEREHGQACLKAHGAPPIPLPVTRPPSPVTTPPSPSPQPSPIKGEGMSTSPPPQELPAELRECLLKELGEEVFSEIKLGKRQATNEEIEKGKQCLEAGKLPVPIVVPPPPSPPPAEVEPQVELQEVQPQPPPPQRVDQSWNKCMLELIGIDALRAITSGARSATPSELEAARICAS